MSKINYKTLAGRTQRYIEFTANAAYDNEGAANAKVASLLLLKNRPIAIGYNSLKTHTLQSKYGKNAKAICLHAEIDVIRKSLNHINVDDLSRCTMIIMRAKKNGDWGLAKPCCHSNGTLGCHSALNAFGIKNVIYSTNENGYVEYLN